MGVDLQREDALRDYELAQGRFFEDRYDALIETSFAKGLHVGVGDEVTLAATRGRIGLKKLRIVGLLSPRGTAGFNQMGVIFVPLPTAQYMYAGKDNINAVSVVLQNGRDEQAVESAVAKILPVGLSVRSATAQSPVPKGNDSRHRKRVELRLSVDDRLGVLHHLQYVPDERRRATEAVGRVAGRRRHEAASHPHAAVGKAWAWAAWARCSALLWESAALTG